MDLSLVCFLLTLIFLPLGDSDGVSELRTESRGIDKKDFIITEDVLHQLLLSANVTISFFGQISEAMELHHGESIYLPHLEGETANQELIQLLLKSEAERVLMRRQIQGLESEISKLREELSLEKERGLRKPSEPTATAAETRAMPKSCEVVLDAISEVKAEILNLRLHGIPEYPTDGPDVTTEAEDHGPWDCYDLFKAGERETGIYTIYPLGNNADGVRVWCDMGEGDQFGSGGGGGWTVVLNRIFLFKEVSFHRSWDAYRKGFGDPETEYWIGNDLLHAMTSRRPQVLRVDMRDWIRREALYAEYNTFYVAGEEEQYNLTVDGYEGTAGDALDYHNGMMFSTPDRDNDVLPHLNCAGENLSGFWFRSCYRTSPTNPHRDPTQADGIAWSPYPFGRDMMSRMFFKIRDKYAVDTKVC